MNSELRENLLRRFLRYFLPGVLLGLILPFLASFFQLLWERESISFAGILEVRSTFPSVMLVAAPVAMGVIGWIMGTLGEGRARDQRIFNEVLVNKQEELQMRNQRLQELNEALDGLVYNASHALKNPVANFQSLIQMLREITQEEGNEKMALEVLQRLEDSTHRFLSTISDLVDVSRIEKQLREESEILVIADCVKSSFEEVQSHLPAQNAQIFVDTEGAPAIFFSGPGLQSIFQNLLSNAIKYSHPDRPPKVKVRSRVEDKGIHIEVADNGVGIDLNAFKDKLFKMFSRLNQDKEGNGIGLYIVKRTIEMAGGKVWVESEEGAGTTFHLQFPVDCMPQA